MINNPEWKPFIEAVRESDAADGRDYSVLREFTATYPARLRPAVALALSVAKWWLKRNGEAISYSGHTCGCCCLFYNFNCPGCGECPLGSGCWMGGNTAVYARILKIYTSHFNALPARDRQQMG